MKKWRVDYVVGNTYKVKFVNAKTNTEAIKKAKVKNIVDLNIVDAKEELLDILGSYRRMIIRDNNTYPTVVLADIKRSIDSVLKRYNYNGRYKEDNIK